MFVKKMDEMKGVVFYPVTHVLKALIFGLPCAGPQTLVPKNE